MFLEYSENIIMSRTFCCYYEYHAVHIYYGGFDFPQFATVKMDQVSDYRNSIYDIREITLSYT